MTSTYPHDPSRLRQIELLEQRDLVADRFQVEALAAVGGSSMVYRARDLVTRELVALKVLALTDSFTHQQFSREVEILSTLTHPSIVRYVAHGTTAAEAPFLVTEWLSGEDLAERLARTGLRTSECHTLICQLCAGLAAAHARGVLHRDIKPSNVFLLDGDIAQVKLLDFGIARHHEASSGYTHSGVLLGTVGYMSPEQIRGSADLDQRSDIFSLGCLLYECLTGQHPFAAEHDVAVVTKMLREQPAPLRSMRPDLGSELEVLLSRLLAKLPEQRPANVVEANREIEKCFAEAKFDDAIVPQQRALGSQAERRILSVVAVRRHENQHSTAKSDAQLLTSLGRAFAADIVKVQAKTWLLIIRAGPHSTPTDQAAHAARCALRLAQSPGFGVALATGPVDSTAQRPLGAAVDRALALLAERAQRVRIDELTWGLLGRSFRISKTGPIIELDSESDDADGVGVLMGRSTPFVGRAKELAILTASLRQCFADDVTRGVLIIGPSGSGKSRLAREFLEREHLCKTARLLIARSDSSTASSPLDLLQRLLRHAMALHVGTKFEAQRAALETFLHNTLGPAADAQLGVFLSEIIGVAQVDPVDAIHRAARKDPDVMREQKRRAFIRFMDLLAAAGPVIMFLEDVHWADLPSLTNVQGVMYSLPNRPLFVLATARPEIDQLFPRLREHSELEVLQLGALTKKASEQLARAVLPEQSPDAVISRVVELAGGNAFYLEELVRRVAEGSSDLPETVVAMAQSRIERLPADARRVLRAASVLGTTASAEGIEQLLASSSADNKPLLDWLVSEEILQTHSDDLTGSRCAYVFRHALLREAAYEMLTDTDRRLSHLRAAEWLESGSECDASVLEHRTY